MSNENGKIPSPKQDAKPTRREKLKVLLKMLLMVNIEIALPFAVYYILKNYMTEIQALLLSGVPPLLVVIFIFIRNRRLDALGVMVTLGFIISAAITAVLNDTKIYLLRESLITFAIGLVFINTLIPIKIGSFRLRPLVFYFARDMAVSGSSGNSNSGGDLPGTTEDESVADRWDRNWDSYAWFRRGFIVMTVACGVGLLAEVPIRVFIVLKMPTDQAFLWSTITSYAWLSLLSLFNALYGNHFKKQCEKAAAAAAANTNADNANKF